MKPRFLLDSNVLSEPVRSHPHPGLMERLERHQGELTTASIVFHELLFGMELLPASKKKTRIKAYLDDLRRSTMPILAYDERAAAWHAAERARLERRGRVLPFRDSQIASIARTYDLALVTANVRDFEGISGLVVENWQS